MRWFRRAGLILALASGGVFVVLPAANAAPVPRAGGVEIVTERGSTTPRDSGGSATPFSLRLPEGAACPGDSANAGYRVQSFIVPATVDPGGLQYNSIGPVGQGMYSLFDVFTRTYAQEQTENAQHEGEPGMIVNLPSFNYAVVPRGSLRDGTYHIGIACSHYNATVKYWSTDIALTNTAQDEPAGLLWHVVGSPSHSAHSAVGSFAVIALAAAALVTVGWFVRRPRARRLR